MTVKYEVGDKVRILNANMIGPAELTNGNIYEIIKVDTDGFYVVDDAGDDMSICDFEYDYVEKVTEPSVPQFDGFVNIRQVTTLENGNLLITLECDEMVNMALIRAERDMYAKKQTRKAEIQTEIARLQIELEALQ